MPELDLGNVKGPQGKSAYQSALDAGYSGSEEAFNTAMAKAPDAVLYTAQSLSDAQKAQARGNINAAPGGFGLGGDSKLLSAVDDLNNIRVTGWYSWSYDSHPQNAPDNNWRKYGCSMHVFASYPDGYAIQTVYDLSDDITHGCAIQRTICPTSSGNIYYPWEWVNPPMELGVEYRTTKRYMGKPVYTMAFSFGALPNASDKVVAMPGTDGTCKIIEIHGYTSNEMTLPGVSGVSEALQVTLTGLGNTAYVKTGADRSSVTATIVAKYIKTTD